MDYNKKITALEVAIFSVIQDSNLVDDVILATLAELFKERETCMICMEDKQGAMQ